jgi:hypothetical protein
MLWLRHVERWVTQSARTQPGAVNLLSQNWSAVGRHPFMDMGLTISDNELVPKWSNIPVNGFNIT